MLWIEVWPGGKPKRAMQPVPNTLVESTLDRSGLVVRICFARILGGELQETKADLITHAEVEDEEWGLGPANVVRSWGPDFV